MSPLGGGGGSIPSDAKVLYELTPNAKVAAKSMILSFALATWAPKKSIYRGNKRYFS
jgi:hypothetical protein